MSESAADVMRKLKAMKAAKLAKSTSSTATKQSANKRKSTDSANDVMEKLRMMKSAKTNNVGKSGRSDISLRIVDPGDDDDDDDDEEDESGSNEGGSDSNGYDSEDGDVDDEEEEFAGFDDGLPENFEADDSDEGPVVVRFDGSRTERIVNAPTPKDRKNFMSQKTPKSDVELEKEEKKNGSLRKKSKADEQDDQMNLKHDVELQRLITESHILSEASRTGSAISLSDVSFSPIGKARLKTMESRIDSLALRGDGRRKVENKDYFSVNPQSLVETQKERFNKTKMPMTMRKGMINKKAERKAKYEKNAKEAGIVLPKAPRNQKKSQRNTRDRGLKIQSVGHFTKSGLKLSKHEIARTSRR
ncbi:hypothetical protein V1512DRAFT_291905 [Lipomyces arxii]|uniref:uncharacterized protein n=1 Tax=Lipomyces arxii TaxID=56418 RepID=UPI0034CE660B